jgi:hypothetical protein
MILFKSIQREHKMNKPFLLIAGDKYYPQRGVGDWVGCYETIEDAEKAYLQHQQEIHTDWYDIVDLRRWTY